MKRKHVLMGVLTILAVAGGVTAYWAGTRFGHPDILAAITARSGSEVGGRRVLYWYDPMNPQQRFDRPGKSPFMDMELIPKYADEGEDAGTVRIDPSLTQNLGLRIATVESSKLVETIDAPATVKFNERDVSIVQARSAGFVERVYASAPGDLVKRGAPLVDLLISEWAGAQIEFIALLKMGATDLAAAARERLVLLGMPAELIRTVERAREPRVVVTVRAPADGVITAVGARGGMNVMAGQMLVEINGFSPVWLEAQVPEGDAESLRPGQRVLAEFPAFPGKMLRGKVAAILPEVNADSRTARVRIELPNPDGQLRPGMFARVKVDARVSGEALLVPSETVIRTGQRTIVMVAEPDGRYRPTQVKLGRESGGRIEVIAGLQSGQQVVASGQFLIDSEASIRGVLAQTSESERVAPAAPLHEGAGPSNPSRPAKSQSLMSPIPTLNFGAMTMSFRLERPDLAKGLKGGDRVRFALRKDARGFTIEKLTKEAQGR